MTVKEILLELEAYGDIQTKKTLAKHGAKEPFFGVKVADLKKILKKTKKNHQLSLDLFKTGNSDAMYLAGLMADETLITEAQLNEWINSAYWYYLNEYAVPWVASETSFGFALGQKWMQSSEESIAAAGWATLSYYAALREDSQLDIDRYSELLDQVALEIEHAPNRVKHVMNAFVIAIGVYIKELSEKALDVAKKIGKVEVILAGAGCKEPLASEYILKAIDKGNLGKKRKSARC